MNTDKNDYRGKVPFSNLTAKAVEREAGSRNAPCLAWFSANEVPEKGRTVWIIRRHWKRIRPLSYSIHAGVVEYSQDKTSWRVTQCDETGQGACSWEPESDTRNHEDFCAWAYAENNSLLPDFV